MPGFMCFFGVVALCLAVAVLDSSDSLTMLAWSFAFHGGWAGNWTISHCLRLTPLVSRGVFLSCHVPLEMDGPEEEHRKDLA